MKFNDFIITDIGFSNVNAAVINEKDIVFKKLVTGTGNWDATDIPDAKELKEPKQEILINKVEILDDKTVRCLATISNAGLEEPYYIKEVGVFIESNGVETLYSISTAKDEIEMPLEAEVGMYQINFNFYQKISTGDVNIRVANDAFVASEDFAVAKNDINEIKGDIFPSYTLELEKDINIQVKSNVVYGNGKFLALVENGYCVSENGEDWGSYTFENFSGEFIAGFIAGKFIVCGPEDKGIYISTTAEIGDWQHINGPGVLIKAAYEVNGRCFLVDEKGNLIEIMNNISSPAFRPVFESHLSGITDITYGNGKYIISTTKGLHSLDKDLISHGIIMNNEEGTFENLEFASVRYTGERFLTVTQEGKIYTSENSRNWENTASLNKTVTRQIEYLNGLFFIPCGRYVYVTKDGKDIESFIISLHDIIAVVNANNKVAFYDTRSRVSYVTVEKSLKNQVAELNSALDTTKSTLNSYISTNKIQKKLTTNYAIGTELAIAPSSNSRLALIIPTFGNINSFAYNVQILTVVPNSSKMKIQWLAKNDGTIVRSGNVDLEIILFPWE